MKSLKILKYTAVISWGVLGLMAIILIWTNGRVEPTFFQVTFTVFIIALATTIINQILSKK